METIKIITKVKNNQLHITIPKKFEAENVEVEITPIKKLLDDDWKKDFSEISVWDINEEEIKVKSWKIDQL
ncbi:MAG: hypothetical protein M1480_05660 [Bacteroidetes bacterium]|nr:hypothetical protein [Bacteroidota bacterium]